MEMMTSSKSSRLRTSWIAARGSCEPTIPTTSCPAALDSAGSVAAKRARLGSTVVLGGQSPAEHRAGAPVQAG